MDSDSGFTRRATAGQRILMEEQELRDHLDRPAIDRQCEVLLSTLAGWDIDTPSWSHCAIIPALERSHDVAGEGVPSESYASATRYSEERMLVVPSNSHGPSTRFDVVPEADMDAFQPRSILGTDPLIASTVREELTAPAYAALNTAPETRSRNTSDRMEGIEYYDVQEAPCRL